MIKGIKVTYHAQSTRIPSIILDKCEYKSKV